VRDVAEILEPLATWTIDSSDRRQPRAGPQDGAQVRRPGRTGRLPAWPAARGAAKFKPPIRTRDGGPPSMDRLTTRPDLGMSGCGRPSGESSASERCGRFRL
jgi:hypothetical protein